MEREDCWMTFSEALERYLMERESRNHFGPGWNRADCERVMKECADHMDALTSLGEKK